MESHRAAEPSTTANEAAEQGKEGTGSARAPQGAAPSQAQPQPLQSNPLRSLGDALREISQRIDEILESEGAEGSREQPADTTGPSQMEYLRPEDDNGEDEMQALGPAQQEDVAKLNDLKFLDEEMEDVAEAENFGEEVLANEKENDLSPGTLASDVGQSDERKPKGAR